MAGSVTFLQATADVSDLAAYTFAGQNLGTASSDRHIVVCAHARRAGTTAIPISSVSVAGVSATIVRQRQNIASNGNVCGIAIAAVPTGTTGSVVVTFAQTMARAAIQVYSVAGIDPTAADSDDSVATDPTASIDVPAGGIAIAAANTANGITAIWTGLTEDADQLVEASLTATSASDQFASAQTGLAITCTNNGAPVNSVGIFASWGPSAGAVQTRRRRSFGGYGL